MTYLETFLNHEKNFKKFSAGSLNLERVRSVLSSLGDPHLKLKIIHVAGSKGKGSVCAFSAHILREAGYRVGLYTSPHLYDARERFRVLEPGAKKADAFEGRISAKDFSALINKIRPQLQSYRRRPRYGDLTYFEVLTVAAFCFFEAKKADLVVLETGLGGRLDATNVCRPLVAAITPISLEHTRQLGKTIRKIAFEKAGIIKENCPVICAPQKSTALAVIESRCRKLKSPLTVPDPCRLPLSLPGAHQKINAGLSVGIIEQLRRYGYRISAGAVKNGLAKTYWPLRFEVLRRPGSPGIVLDGAHNPESCRCLAETFMAVFPGQKPVLIFGCSEDKDAGAMARILRDLSGDIILTVSKHPRAVNWKDTKMKNYFKKDKVMIADSVKTACRTALRLCHGNRPVLVTGSLFVAAEAKEFFEHV